MTLTANPTLQRPTGLMRSAEFFLPTANGSELYVPPEAATTAIEMSHCAVYGSHVTGT